MPTVTPTVGSIVWVNGTYTSPSGAASSASVALDNVGAGHTLIVSFNVGAGFTETLSNAVTSTGPSALSWQLAISKVSSHSQINVWYASVPVSGAYIVTGHATASTALGISVDEYGGITQLLSSAGKGGTNNAPSVTSTVPLNMNVLVFGSVTWDSGNRTLTPGVGFSTRQSFASGNQNQPIGIEDQTGTTTSTSALANWTLSSSSKWTAVVAVFSS